MRPAGAWLLLAAATVATWFALTGAWPGVLGLAFVCTMAVRRGRLGLMVFAAATLLVNTLLLAWLSPGAETVAVGPLQLGTAGAMLGAVGALRVIAIVALNQAILTHLPLPVWLDGLRLPVRATAFLAAVLLASRDVGRDFGRLRDARRLDGAWPHSRLARARAAAALLAPLLVASWRRAETRREALRLAGIAVGRRFAPIVAVTALAVAGRLAFIAIPNVALTYVVVFAGGLAFGAVVGFWSGFWAMALTDLLLSGLAPGPYVNAPAMGLLGALGGALQPRQASADVATLGMLAATAGVVGTLWFSIVTDVATWALVPEFRTSWTLLRLRVLAGLVFNAVPAITNGVLFALAAAPVSRAFAALHGHHGQHSQHPERGP